MTESQVQPWADHIFQVLTDYKVRQVAYVPDAGHARLIQMCRESGQLITVPLTTEEEGVALICGAWLGGHKGVLLMQSSGVGNCINMLTLPRVCQIPLLMLVTMRGDWGEFNPWQIPMGQMAEKALSLAGVLTFYVHDLCGVKDAVEAAARMAFEGSAQTAVLLSQRILGAKTFGR